ncbi:ribosomal L7Ae/L30e/S12e/Gadd45 family protein [Chryseomicrobium aureum]|uniref:ribosomal L7Ae/L30e/S12e/Gadd45 family protein n=1 Tax=Chryseomicrobium aureum TaxID=1441723 RepID=UPI003595144A
MSYEKVKQAQKTIIGTKQAVKAARNGHLSEIIVAMDVDHHVIAPVLEVAREFNIPVTNVPSKQQLGKVAGLRVHASVVAIADSRFL